MTTLTSEYYQLLFAKEKDAVLVIAAHSGQILAANQAAVSLYGYAEVQLLRMPVFALSEDQEHSPQYLATASAEDALVFPLRWHKKHDGTRFPVEISNYRMVQNEEVQVLAVIRDISERLAQQHLLAERERTFRLIYEDAPVMLYSFDNTGNITNVNRYWLETTGYRREEVVGHNIAAFITPKSMQQVLQVYRPQLWGQGELRGAEYELLQRNGRILLIEMHAVVTENLNDRPTAIAVMHNITERRRAEQQQRLATQVFHNASEGILITDAKTRIIAVNPAFTNITGYSADRAVGKRSRMFSPEDPTLLNESMLESLQHSGHWQGEMLDRRANGEVYPAWLSISAVRDEGSLDISHYVGVFTDITERKKNEQQLHFMANHDVLTKLPNRALFHDRLNHAIANASRQQLQLAVLFIDLDRFKLINDTLGHAAGDEVLRALSRRLLHCLRDTDTLARPAGDEFTAVLEGIHQANDAAVVAQRMLQALEPPVLFDNQQIFMSASIGIALYPTDAVEAATLLKFADVAMYRAKEQGKNNFQFYSAEMNAVSLERLLIENSLRNALEREQLVVFYQPQVDSRSGKIVGAEALLRWRHPQLGMIPPSRFIAIAEETGLIAAMGEWVLRQACLHLVAWGQAGYALSIAVNLSARQFLQGNIARSVAKILQETGANPQCLELEITESMIMRNPDEAIEMMHALNGLGVKLAIDDFGTGYSSLSTLKRFPIDTLKVDRSFIQNIPNDSQDMAITEAVVQMAKSLKLAVVAEGVETEEQQVFLSELGCDYLQGYLISPPVAVGEFLPLLSRTFLVSRCLT